MPFKLTITLLSLALCAFAGPSSQRAKCSKGRTAGNAVCCKWFDILDDIQVNLFDNFQCGEETHESLRLTFHDAISYSPKMTKQGKYGGGGADGSIMAYSSVETLYHANDGVSEIIEEQRPFPLKYNVSFGDFIQFAGAVGLSNCRGAPRLEFLTGRPNASQPSPDLLVPEPSDPIDTIIARFADVGFNANEIVDLLASHSVAAQDTIDPSIHGSPFDSSPSTFDSKFFVETLIKGTIVPGNGTNVGQALSPIAGEFRLQSDAAFARDPRTACEWQSFITNHDLMKTKFRAAMAKLAVVGQNRNHMIDCSEVISEPPSIPVYDMTLPAGKTMQDVEASCKSKPFPSLAADPGPPSTIPVVPPT